MKIEKLHTLSQFIEIMQQKEINDPEVVLFMIFAYNEKLKEFATEDISDELILLDGVLIWKTEPIGGHFKDWNDINKVMTYEKLAEKTNGQLKIKPFEL